MMRSQRRNASVSSSLTRLLALVVLVALTPFAAPGAPRPAAAQTLLPGLSGLVTRRIDPVLLQQMAADRTRALPIIVEMAPPPPPFQSGVNQQLAQRALALLQL